MSNKKQWVTRLQTMTAVAISAMSIQSSFASVAVNNSMTDTFWQTQKKGRTFLGNIRHHLKIGKMLSKWAFNFSVSR